jgi:glyoxylase-like metal-dependent hydrolase (beta-lactamase superfamily II)
VATLFCSPAFPEYMERIPLGNTVFEGRNNVYLLDGETVALVDTGIATADVRTDLSDGLVGHGYAVDDVDAVFLTHWHHDHAGLAGEIQAESGATVYVHEADAPLVAGESGAVDRLQALQSRKFDEWGIPEAPRTELEAYLAEHASLSGDPADVTVVRDGDSVELGDLTLTAVHLPGHAAGLSAYLVDDGVEAFVGDAILPKYTPNVGGADVRVESPLEQYVESLHRLVDLDLDRAFPGHRDPIDDPTGRALTILDHHRERTRRVVEVLATHGPCDAWTVSAHLFGDLAEIHILHGPGEAYAHLDHLAAAGVVERTGTEYELVDPEVDVAALFPALDRPA